MLSSVSGCWKPSTVFFSSSVRRCAFAASSHLPCYRSASARLFMPVSVEGCWRPSTVFLSSPSFLFILFEHLLLMPACYLLPFP